MGWPWSSKPSTNSPNDDILRDSAISSSDLAQPSKTTFGLTDEQRLKIFGPNSIKPEDRQADKDFESLIQSLSPPNESTSKTTNPTQTSSEPQSTTSNTVLQSPTTNDSPTISRYNADGSINIHPDALYPTRMSCRQAFDEAFYCQSLGGKFNDIYRFGAIRSCSEHWASFWFCMRTRTMQPDERAPLVREHYARREGKKLKDTGTSEDIWEIRTVGVKRAFQRDPDAEDGGEWPVRE